MDAWVLIFSEIAAALTQMSRLRQNEQWNETERRWSGRQRLSGRGSVINCGWFKIRWQREEWAPGHLQSQQGHMGSRRGEDGTPAFESCREGVGTSTSNFQRHGVGPMKFNSQGKERAPRSGHHNVLNPGFTINHTRCTCCQGSATYWINFWMY